MRFDTHEVFNQPPPYRDVDLLGNDRPLQEAVAANGAGQEAAALAAFGRRWGSAPMLDLARQANQNPPVLRAFDAHGRRLDIVEFHPAYHALMAESIGAGLHSSTWLAQAKPAGAPAEVARAARFYMVAQVENGHMCPITMTRAAVAAFAGQPDLVGMLMPKLQSRHYDPEFRPWREKSGITLGMGMTEKQGGTDVRANTTTAERSTDGYRLTGHKWFMSAPMSDGFLTLAQAPDGLTCFFMPRFEPDGRVNGLRLMRLKDKLGNRSNASAEVEFTEAFASRVGDEGRGVRTILQMVQLTRLDCAIASAGMIRAGLAQAVFHSRHRSVFQKRLADQPMMRAVLADMALDVEGAIAAVMRLCRSFDHAGNDPAEAARARLLTPALKYWICKIAPNLVYEAMECLGGNGYVEDGALARLYREAPVNAIWEGSGNVVCLDVLRAFNREPEAARAVVAALAGEARDVLGTSDVQASIERTVNSHDGEANARAGVERLALLAAAAALAGTAPTAVAEAFARTRLGAGRSAIYGASDLENATARLLLARAWPAD